MQSWNWPFKHKLGLELTEIFICIKCGKCKQERNEKKTEKRKICENVRHVCYYLLYIVRSVVQIRRQARQLVQRYYQGSLAAGKFQRSMTLGNPIKETSCSSLSRPKAPVAGRRVQRAHSPVRDTSCAVAVVKARTAWDDAGLNSSGEKKWLVS